MDEYLSDMIKCGPDSPSPYVFNLDIYYHITIAITPNFVLFRGNHQQHMGMWIREVQCPSFQGVTLTWDSLRTRCGCYPKIQLHMGLFSVPSLMLPAWCEVIISNLRGGRWKIQRQKWWKCNEKCTKRAKILRMCLSKLTSMSSFSVAWGCFVVYTHIFIEVSLWVIKG